MKNIKNLTPYFRDLTDDELEHQKVVRKNKALEKWMELNIPNNLIGKYSFSDFGSSCIRVFIYLDKNEDSTIALMKWLPKLKKQRFELEKFWRKENGYFSFRIERKYNNCNNYLILVEESANIDGCKIVEKEITQTIFVTDCENERVIL